MTTGKEFERFFVSFAVSKGPLLASLRKTVPVYKVFSVTPELLHICRSLSYESGAANPHRQEMLQALLTQLVIHVERLLQLTQGHGAKANTHENDTRSAYIDNFFSQNFACHASRAELARQLHLSERQLLRVLQQTYGMGFQKKLVSSRMDYASYLLRTTERPVAEIAGSVGYASEAAFFQVFKSYFQMTPQQYRIRCRQK